MFSVAHKFDPRCGNEVNEGPITNSHTGRNAMEKMHNGASHPIPPHYFPPYGVMKAVFRTAQEWKHWLQNNYEELPDVYGNCYRERSSVLLEGLRFFRREMKETSSEPLCIFRSPARINLRGMHVDKHGGACNGVAINRETVFYATRPSQKGLVTLLNKGHGTVSVSLMDVTRANPQLKQGWEKYVYAAIQAAMKEFALERGFTACVVSDIPQGSGLSSSHSFIVSLLCVLLQFNGIDFREHKMKLVRLAQATEFLTGTVTGLSDQGVILFAKRGSVTHANFYEADGNEKIEQGIKYAKLPTEAKILVVDSHTPRCLSGDAGVDYAIPRFANSLSLHLLHDICQRKGMPAQFDRIASLSKTYSSDVLLGLIQSLPAQMTLTDIEALFAELSGKMDTSLERYMNTLLKSNHQRPLSLRGPIMFTVAECSRADEFFQCLKSLEIQTSGPRRTKILSKVGSLMNVGHEGDNPTQDFMIHDTQFRSWARKKTPIYMIPGAFKASTTSLDCIQQILLERGAVGACLTGAGLGGCVVGLFSDLYVEEVVQSLQNNYFCKTGYKASTSVFEACSVKGASFI